MLLARQFFTILCEIKLSLQSRALLADLIFYSAPSLRVFHDFYVRSSSPYSLVHFLPTSSSKIAPSPTVFYDFCVRSSSPYSLVHFLPTSSSKSAPSPTVFYDFYVRSSSGYRLVHFLPASSSRKELLARHFLTIFMWDRALPTVSCPFCRPHLPKVLLARQFFYRPSSPYSLVHFLPTSSSKSAPSPTIFYDSFVRSSSPYSLVHFLPTSSSKSAPSPTVFYGFMWDQALPTVSCTSCWPHLLSAPSLRVFHDF